MPATKIATCCYCGTRAALVLRGKDRHELSCSNCGAPLRVLKMLPMSSGRGAALPATPVRPAPKTHAKYDRDKRNKRPKKQRKMRRLGRKVFEE